MPQDQEGQRAHHVLNMFSQSLRDLHIVNSLQQSEQCHSAFSLAREFLHARNSIKIETLCLFSKIRQEDAVEAGKKTHTHTLSDQNLNSEGGSIADEQMKQLVSKSRNATTRICDENENLLASVHHIRSVKHRLQIFEGIGRSLLDKHCIESNAVHQYTIVVPQNDILNGKYCNNYTAKHEHDTTLRFISEIREECVKLQQRIDHMRGKEKRMRATFGIHFQLENQSPTTSRTKKTDLL